LKKNILQKERKDLDRNKERGAKQKSGNISQKKEQE